MRSALALLALPLSLCLVPVVAPAQTSKPPITLDEYLSSSSITDAFLSPDGSAAVIATEAPDWKNDIYRDDLWLWTKSAGLRPLTHSGSEQDPRWSPDGKWIAFISDRALPGEKTDSDGGPADDSDKADRIWIISVSGGEALPLFHEKLDVHTFAWSPDSSSIYYAVTQPLTTAQQDAEKQEWKDVIRWREQERGDVLVEQAVAPALARAFAVPLPSAGQSGSPSSAVSNSTTESPAASSKPAETLPPTASAVTKSTLLIQQIAPAPDGKTVAFVTSSISHRVEDPADFEIYSVPASGGTARRITHNQGIESHLSWSRDGRWLHFQVDPGAGCVEGPYKDVQGRLYRMDAATGAIQRLGAEFTGSLDHYTLLPDGRVLAAGLKGTQAQVYLIDGPRATLLPGLAGTYSGINAGLHSSRLLLTFSTVTQPTQVYLADNPLHPDQLLKLTDFNPVFAQRAQPEWQTFTWKADDGRTIEGMLIFPPGKKDARHLRMFTLIHGGPEDADGNRFGADWYDWATLAADRGWLVFRPNYRGSTGYGDDFMLEIRPHLVSVPGRDILTGVDALVKEGYADPTHLAIGGYSYGGYMTNWLITQTDRFESAVTGAGAIEHAANWGNDDLTYDDAWFLGGRPWEDPSNYQSEAALFQFNKVKTPVHLVQGGADVRVSYLEGVLIERALQSLGIPHTFLTFPGEGHSLDKNPWHGYIKVREELKWLDKYDKK